MNKCDWLEMIFIKNYEIPRVVRTTYLSLLSEVSPSTLSYISVGAPALVSDLISIVWPFLLILSLYPAPVRISSGGTQLSSLMCVSGFLEKLIRQQIFVFLQNQKWCTCHNCRVSVTNYLLRDAGLSAQALFCPYGYYLHSRNCSLSQYRLARDL